MDALETARQMLREYGDRAEEECESRASYHELEGDKEAAMQWRVLKQAILILRASEAGKPN